MVRATYARVLVRLGGTYPAGVTQASVTSMCTSMDYKLDAFTYPDVLSTTDDTVIEVCVDGVLNMLDEQFWFHAGGYQSGKVRPKIISDEMKETIARLQTDTTYDGYASVKMQD